MSLKTAFVSIRDGYVINQVEKLNIPSFEADTVKRYRVFFRGRVQKVGFRLELYELANRLELTGFCKNLENGDVLAELQGPENKINYAVSFLESLKCIKITNKRMEELEVRQEETEFVKQ